MRQAGGDRQRMAALIEQRNSVRAIAQRADDQVGVFEDPCRFGIDATPKSGAAASVHPG